MWPNTYHNQRNNKDNYAVFKKLLFFITIALSIVGCSVIDKKTGTIRHKPNVVILPEKGDKLPRSYSINGVLYYPLFSGDGFVQEGLASWYGEEFHGMRTANGEVYNMYKKTAAHKTLPFGTYVKVKNLSNKREVVVKINDRGPFVKGRIIDLSLNSAKEIGLVKSGIAKVRLVALSREVGTVKSGDKYRPVIEVKDYKKGHFTFQVGAFENRENSQKLAKRLRDAFDNVTVTPYNSYRGKPIYRVRVFLFSDLIEARQLEKKLQQFGFSDYFIVAF